MAPEGVFIKTSTHPRAYGNFARLLGKYVRDEHVIPLEEAIRKLTSLPAATLRIKERGRLAARLLRRRRRLRSRRRSRTRRPTSSRISTPTGVRHVWVNGVQVLKDGEHTGEKPGRVVRGPGWKTYENVRSLDLRTRARGSKHTGVRAPTTLPRLGGVRGRSGP